MKPIKELLQALMDGKELQYQYVGPEWDVDFWSDLMEMDSDGNPSLNSVATEYLLTGIKNKLYPMNIRIKPEETE